MLVLPSLRNPITQQDKVKISSLSMISEDYSESLSVSQTLYKIIRDRLMTRNRERLLPLVYLIDSILKNAKGHFVRIVENDAENWLPLVFQKLPENQKPKLQKVFKLWVGLFDSEKYKVMGQCFDISSNSSMKQTISTDVAGITRTVCNKPIMFSETFPLFYVFVSMN